ncbi:hypothetical protein EQ875_01660 [Photobacterium damselae subsp. damselae]|uniref:hypothetical protein n=1 Tax=Photobacterium damselae TaxID=38293 RepID=UPI00109B9A43|nr:hypothetical protein [Photobacterium damselae]TGZ35379.1 hypothetical protein EQ875_01660 [Photobacterium damselae subsp. damselae]
MVPVTEFLPTLRMLVDVPIPGVMETAIIKAARKFCRDSKILVKTRRFEEVHQYQSASIVEASTELKGAGIVSVTSNGKQLSSGSDYQVDGLDGVKFNASFSEVLVVGIAEPKANTDQLPTILLDDYVDGICAGAASMLQMMPGATWTQPELAQVNERDFVSAIRHAYRYSIEQTPELEETRPMIKREFY